MKKHLPIFWAILFIVMIIILIRFAFIAGSIGVNLNWKWIFWGIIIASLIGGIFWWSSRGRSSSTTTRSFPRWAKKTLGLALIVIIAFLLYREWNFVEKSAWWMKGLADKATTVEFTIDSPDSFKGKSWPNLLPSGRYRINVSKGEYRYTCPGGYKSEFYGNTNTEGMLTVRPDGRALLWSEATQDKPRGSGEAIIVGKNGTIFAKFDTGCPGSEQEVVQTLDVSIQFIPIR